MIVVHQLGGLVLSLERPACVSSRWWTSQWRLLEFHAFVEGGELRVISILHVLRHLSKVSNNNQTRDYP
jgi:hypothetical protein